MTLFFALWRHFSLYSVIFSHYDVTRAIWQNNDAILSFFVIDVIFIQACPEDWARNELSAHINKIKFYCHQLNMCAKVKAEVQNIAHELVVSGLDSATSLIQVKFKTLENFLKSCLGRQKSHELCRLYRQIFIRRLHKIQEPWLTE